MKLTYLIAALTCLSISQAEEPAKGKPAGDTGEWKVLLDGKSLDGWMSASGGAPGGNWKLEDGAMARTGSAGDIWTKERYGDFVLEVEFKTKGNSGVFIRTDNPKDPVQTGIEIQVDNPGGPNKHSVGALYDLVAPTRNAAKKDDWNKFVITCEGGKISVELNGEKINQMNVDDWKDAGKNPDGTNNKYKRAVKDWKREGHIGFQDHGGQVAYRNVRVKLPARK